MARFRCVKGTYGVASVHPSIVFVRHRTSFSRRSVSLIYSQPLDTTRLRVPLVPFPEPWTKVIECSSLAVLVFHASLPDKLSKVVIVAFVLLYQHAERVQFIPAVLQIGLPDTRGLKCVSSLYSPRSRREQGLISLYRVCAVEGQETRYSTAQGV
jgi:hypothetical protein